MKPFTIALITTGSLAGVIALGFALQALDLGFYAFWAPKYKAVDRQVGWFVAKRELWRSAIFANHRSW